MGAAIMGPTASPSTNSDNARIETVRETLNRSAISGVAGEIMEEPQVTEKPRHAVAAVWYAFLVMLLVEHVSAIEHVKSSISICSSHQF
jgi:hypothetical protein